MRMRPFLGGVALGVLALLVAVTAVYCFLVLLMPDAWVNVHLDDPPPLHRRMTLWSLMAGLAAILGVFLSSRVAALAFGYLLGFLGGLLFSEWLIFSYGRVFSSAPPEPFVPDPWLYLPVLAIFAIGPLTLAIDRRRARPRPNESPIARPTTLADVAPPMLAAAALMPLWWWFGSPPGAAGANQTLTNGVGSIGTYVEPSALWSGSVRCRWPADSGDRLSLSGFDFPLPRPSGERIVGLRVGSYVELRTTAIPPNLTSISEGQDFAQLSPDGSSGFVVIRDVHPDLVISWACAPIGDFAASLTLPTPASDELAGSISETTQHLTIREGVVDVEPKSIPAGSIDVTVSSDAEALVGLTIYVMLLGPLTPDHLARLANGDIDWRGEFFEADAKGEPGIVGVSWDLEIDNLQAVGGVTLEPGTYAWVVLDPLSYGTFEVR